MSRPVRHPVLLHGFSGSSASWTERLIDGLAGTTAPPVLVDLPGHGLFPSSLAEGEVTLAATLSRISVSGNWPTDLLGYSMGGRIALHFAAKYPERVRSLILESSSPGLATEAERAARRTADEALALRIEKKGIEDFVDFWESLPLFASQRALDAPVLGKQRALRLQNDARALATALRGLGTGSLPSLWNRLPEIRTRTLLLAGALDQKFVDVARRMAALMPQATLVIVPDAGHAVHLDHPGAWLDAVTSFLAGL